MSTSPGQTIRTIVRVRRRIVRSLLGAGLFRDRVRMSIFPLAADPSQLLGILCGGIKRPRGNGVPRPHRPIFVITNLTRFSVSRLCPQCPIAILPYIAAQRPVQATTLLVCSYQLHSIVPGRCVVLSFLCSSRGRILCVKPLVGVLEHSSVLLSKIRVVVFESRWILRWWVRRN